MGIKSARSRTPSWRVPLARIRRLRESWGFALALAGTCLWPEPAAAQSQAPREEPGAAVLDYWKNDRERLFLGAQAAVGIPSRLQLAIGYGRPYFAWGGLAAQGMLTHQAALATGEIRVELVVINLTVGYRETFSFVRGALQPKAIYSPEDLASANIAHHYGALDTQLFGWIPAGPTVGWWSAQMTYLPQNGSGRALYEEWLRTPVNDPIAWAFRGAWYLQAWDKRFRFGPTAEVILTASRPALFRAGCAFALLLTRHLSLEGTGTVPVTSPDALTFLDQTFAMLRLNYRWASGESEPGI